MIGFIYFLIINHMHLFVSGSPFLYFLLLIFISLPWAVLELQLSVGPFVCTSVGCPGMLLKVECVTQVLWKLWPAKTKKYFLIKQKKLCDQPRRKFVFVSGIFCISRENWLLSKKIIQNPDKLKSWNFIKRNLKFLAKCWN